MSRDERVWCAITFALGFAIGYLIHMVQFLKAHAH